MTLIAVSASEEAERRLAATAAAMDIMAPAKRSKGTVPVLTNSPVVFAYDIYIWLLMVSRATPIEYVRLFIQLEFFCRDSASEF